MQLSATVPCACLARGKYSSADRQQQCLVSAMPGASTAVSIDGSSALCPPCKGHALAENSFKNRSIGLVGLIVSLQNDRNGRGFPQSERGFKNFTRALRATILLGTPLHKILDPPLLSIRSHCCACPWHGRHKALLPTIGTAVLAPGIAGTRHCCRQ